MPYYFLFSNFMANFIYYSVALLQHTILTTSTEINFVASPTVNINKSSFPIGFYFADDMGRILSLRNILSFNAVITNYSSEITTIPIQVTSCSSETFPNYENIAKDVLNISLQDH
jgi:hypothetical protein